MIQVLLYAFSVQRLCVFLAICLRAASEAIAVWRWAELLLKIRPSDHFHQHFLRRLPSFFLAPSMLAMISTEPTHEVSSNKTIERNIHAVSALMPLSWFRFSKWLHAELTLVEPIACVNAHECNSITIGSSLDFRFEMIFLSRGGRMRILMRSWQRDADWTSLAKNSFSPRLLWSLAE